jgi:hypothetical protein
MSVLPPARVQMKGRVSLVPLCADPATVPPLLTPEAVPDDPPNVPRSVKVPLFQKKGLCVFEPVTNSPTTLPHPSMPCPMVCAPPGVLVSVAV